MNLLLEHYYDQVSLERDVVVNKGRDFQQCSLSLMDTIEDPDIRFDDNGICNYFKEYKQAEAQFVIPGAEGKMKFEGIVNKIIDAGKNRKYDCILGLSGGVDSTYLCWLAKQYNLRPLIVHFDNGWNSELAVSNIEQTISRLGFDLYTYVVDWPEFRELQLSYLKASVVDIEVLTDHAFMAVLYEQARKWNIKFVLAGMNIVTEQVLPKYWIYNKGDDVNIKDIQSKYGRTPVSRLKSYPFLNYTNKLYCERVLKMDVISPLNFIEYKYTDIKDLITQQLGWRDYGGKHYESVWTRFYQGYILPRKFHIDKRKAHYSNLIFSGQLTKSKAINLLAEPMYEQALLRQDVDFVLKKLGLEVDEFEKLMRLPRREHREFQTLKGFKDRYPVVKFLSKVTGRKK